MFSRSAPPSDLQSCLAEIHSAELVRFTLAFGVLFFVLLWVYQALPGTAAYAFYLEEMTVKPAVALIRLASGNEGVLADGYRLVWEGNRLSVLTGCDGADAMLLLIAALLASSLPWRSKLTGVLLGTVMVYALNIGRIAALYFAFRHDRGLFELVHGILGPLLVIGAVLLFVLALKNRHEHTAPA